MEDLKIQENKLFCSYYRYKNSIFGLTKDECDQIDLAILDFNHLNDVPEDIKIRCSRLQYSPIEKLYYYDDTSLKEEISICKLEFLYKKL